MTSIGRVNLADIAPNHPFAHDGVVITIDGRRPSPSPAPLAVEPGYWDPSMPLPEVVQDDGQEAVGPAKEGV